MAPNQLQARLSSEVRRCRFAGNAGCCGGRACSRFKRPVSASEECVDCVLDRLPELRPAGWERPGWLMLPHPPAPQAHPAMKPRTKPQGPPAPLLMYPESEEPARHWVNLYKGASAFLLCGGPSLKAMDLRPLIERRGFLLAAVNNAPATLEPGYIRPDLWFHVDKPWHFLQHLWLDPGIAKFVPHNNRGERLREKRGGVFRMLNTVAGAAANTWSFKRFSPVEMDTGDFLTHPTHVCWGEMSQMGNYKRLSVMYAALRLLHHVGVRTVYLVGADFKMQAGRSYGFGQEKDERGAATNNGSYANLDDRLTRLRPHFEENGFHVFNATPESYLQAFPRIPYEEAVARARGRCGEPVDAGGWYG